MIPDGTSHAALASGDGAALEETQGTKTGRGGDGPHLCGPQGLRASQESSEHRREVSKGAIF